MWKVNFLNKEFTTVNIEKWNTKKRISDIKCSCQLAAIVSSEQWEHTTLLHDILVYNFVIESVKTDLRKQQHRY